MVAGSLATSLARLISLPPETVEGAVRVPVAAAPMLTVMVMAGYAVAVARTSLRVQVRVPRVQVQPVPAIAVAVIPAGRVLTTVTVPAVEAGPRLEAVAV